MDAPAFRLTSASTRTTTTLLFQKRRNAMTIQQPIGFLLILILLMSSSTIPVVRAQYTTPYIEFPPGVRCISNRNGYENLTCDTGLFGEGGPDPDANSGYVIMGAGAGCTNPPPKPDGQI